MFMVSLVRARPVHGWGPVSNPPQLHCGSSEMCHLTSGVLLNFHTLLTTISTGAHIHSYPRAWECGWGKSLNNSVLGCTSPWRGWYGRMLLILTSCGLNISTQSSLGSSKCILHVHLESSAVFKQRYAAWFSKEWFKMVQATSDGFGLFVF